MNDDERRPMPMAAIMTKYLHPKVANVTKTQLTTNMGHHIIDIKHSFVQFN